LKDDGAGDCERNQLFELSDMDSAFIREYFQDVLAVSIFHIPYVLLYFFAIL
jgi:hypothetical protein